MKLTINNGIIVCTLEDKNSDFLRACTGMFDGYLNGNLKLYSENAEEWLDPDNAVELNANQVKRLLINAKLYGIEVDKHVNELSENLQLQTEKIRIKRQTIKEEQKRKEFWERLCKNGCDDCPRLAYDVDTPICKQTGEILKEKNLQEYIGGVLYLFKFVAVPSEACPFNINKHKEQENV